MISFFRRMFSSKIGIVLSAIFVAVIAVSFGMADLSGVGGGGGFGAGGATLAEIEGEEITASEISDQVNRQLTRAREQQPELDLPTFLRGGAFEEILNQLISLKATTAFGREQGLAASKRMVDGEIASIPAFRGLDGQFDQATFERAIQAENITEKQLREDIATSLIQRQLLLPVAASAKVPQGMALQYASLLLEQREGSVGLVPSSAFTAGPAPTEAEVNAFYRQNQARYMVPERRVLRYAAFGPEQVAARATPTDADIQAFYTANQATYGPKETRTLSQVVLPDEAAARAFAARVAGGTPFAQAAQQAGFGATDIAVGQQSKQEFANLTSAAVANAAFAAAEGATTAPTRSDFGWHVVRIDEVQTTPARPLASVRDEIASQLAGQKREQAIADMVVRIEDALGEGSSFEEVARAEGLTIQETPALTATGVQFDNPAFRAPEIAPLLKAAFELSPEDDPLVETLVPNQRFAILAVRQVVPAAAPLAQIRDQVRQDFTQKRASDRARAVAQALVTKIGGGTAPREAFAEAGAGVAAPQQVSGRRLDIAQANTQVPPPLAMLFSMAKGRAKLLPAPNGEGWFVVHLAETTPGNAANAPGLVEATRTQFARILGEEYAGQFSRAVERSLEIERDADAIAAAKRALLGPGAQ